MSTNVNAVNKVTISGRSECCPRAPVAPRSGGGPRWLGGDFESPSNARGLAASPSRPPPATRGKSPPGPPSGIRLSDGGNRRDWFPGVRGSGRSREDVIQIIALVLANLMNQALTS